MYCLLPDSGQQKALSGDLSRLISQSGLEAPVRLLEPVLKDTGQFLVVGRPKDGAVLAGHPVYHNTPGGILFPSGRFGIFDIKSLMIGPEKINLQI